MRRLLLAVAATMALAGCGTAGSPAATVHPVTAAPPAVADPVEIVIPAIRITDRLVPVGLCETVTEPWCPDGEGEMELPPVQDTGWYRLGPRPGEPGRAILAGHVDWDGQPGAFKHLPQVKVGDLVTTKAADGTETTWSVYATREVKKARYAEVTVPLLFDPTAGRELALVTCSGAVIDHSYDSNTIVLARAI